MNTSALDGEIITNRLDDWRMYQGVRSSRIFAFLMDYVIVFFLCIRNDRAVEVLDGLADGEDVVARAGTFVANGDRVTPMRIAAETTGAVK